MVFGQEHIRWQTSGSIHWTPEPFIIRHVCLNLFLDNSKIKPVAWSNMSAVLFFRMNLSTWATWMAVSTLSPVIMTTRCEESVISPITSRLSGFRGQEMTAKPANVKSRSKSPLKVSMLFYNKQLKSCLAVSRICCVLSCPNSRMPNAIMRAPAWANCL